jgi:hypothetical protein
MNNKLKVITRRAFGFRTYRAMEIALYHALGDLPDPAAQPTHSFAEEAKQSTSSGPFRCSRNSEQ